MRVRCAQPVCLHSDERHEERAVYEQGAKARRAQSEAEARAAAAEAQARADAELAAERKAHEFKARPVPREVLLGQPVSLAAVAKRALTVAVSPHFRTTMRLMARRQTTALGSEPSC